MMLCILMFVLIASFSASAQKHSSEAVQNAIRALRSGNTELKKANALTVLEKAAENDSDAYAMNALGLAYMNGIGTERNASKAVSWLEKSGENGHRNAWHNLGLMYKDAKATAQDFVKACEYFRKGANDSTVLCSYDLGFMLYKGLGCKQDYGQAVKLFRIGARYNHAPSLYMLGLCLRNGYGIPCDTTEAMKCLNRSAVLGYRDATEELLRPLPENCLGDDGICSDTLTDVPTTMPEIIEGSKDTAMLAGSYSGVLVMYDWSGSHIIGEKPVAMTLHNIADRISGELQINSDTVDFHGGITADGTIAFQSGALEMKERYTGETIPVNYRMDYARLNNEDGKLSGRLALYSLKLYEPERPMYIELNREWLGNNADKHNNEGKDEISIAPNPFDYQFDAMFKLQQGATNVTALIFNRDGILIERISLGDLEAGEHRITLMPSISSGLYVLNIKAGSQTLRTIIKKG